MPNDYIYSLPEISSVDFADGREVGAVSHLLLVLLQRSGRFCCGVPSEACSKSLLPKAKEWLKRIGERGDGIPVASIVEALEGYDILHRLAYGMPDSSQFPGRCYMRAFTERMKGNREVSETGLYGAVAERLRAGDKAFFGNPLRWYGKVLGKWFEEFRRCGGFCESPLSTSLLRGSYLLQADLFAYAGSRQDKFKRMVAARYLPEIMPSSSDDGPTLRAKLMFAQRSRRFLPSADEIEHSLLEALASSPDLHPLSRQAFSLTASLTPALASAI